MGEKSLNSFAECRSQNYLKSNYFPGGTWQYSSPSTFLRLQFTVVLKYSMTIFVVRCIDFGREQKNKENKREREWKNVYSKRQHICIGWSDVISNNVLIIAWENRDGKIQFATLSYALWDQKRQRDSAEGIARSSSIVKQLYSQRQSMEHWNTHTCIACIWSWFSKIIIFVVSRS